MSYTSYKQPTPETTRDFHFNKRVMEEITDAVNSKKNMLLGGTPGIGKTTFIRLLAKEKNAQIVEFNASDERNAEFVERVEKLSNKKMMGLTWVFLDEIDGFSSWTKLESLLKTTKIPIVMTANKIWEIPKSIKDQCVVVEIPSPTEKQVTAAMLRAGYKENLENMPRDFRSANFVLKFGALPVELEDTRLDIERLLKEHKITRLPENWDIWILDNAVTLYTGKNLFAVLNILSDAVYYNSKEILAVFPAASGYGFVQFPKFYRKRRSGAQQNEQ
jgi:DNA polymerase III delta prime subunit